MNPAATRRPADNPFRVERLDAIEFRPQGVAWADLMQRLAGLSFRAAVVGPHGSGKTTLLKSLASRLSSHDLRPRMLFRNRDGGGAMPAHWRPTLETLTPEDVLLVDGYDHLGLVPRQRLRRLTRGSGGLIVTSHRRTALPTLLHTTTSPALLMELASDLASDPPGLEVASALHARHRGNLRNALRELYDRAADPSQ